MRIALRIDDIGASTKRYEIYSSTRFGNILFLKYLKPFRAWGPYRELTPKEWRRTYDILEKHGAFATVGVTATWVEANGNLTTFPEKFPGEAEILRQGAKKGLLEIANHGLTHCVVGSHLPRAFSSNRKYHREFWEWIPREVHFEHMETSQHILQDWIGEQVTTFIPPGNVYSKDTVEAAEASGIIRINSYRDIGAETHIKFIGEDDVVAFHDRELVVNGVEWLDKKLSSLSGQIEYVFVRDL
jgi:peptidoglycan/xylan/chitin deacetylase (PgdA/CDA1 family)